MVTVQKLAQQKRFYNNTLCNHVWHHLESHMQQISAFLAP